MAASVGTSLWRHTVKRSMRTSEPASMGKSSRDKGARAEREFANIMRDELGDDVVIERRLEQTRDAGHDLSGLDPFAVEVKRCETLAIPKWWRQTTKQAEAASQRPALAYRQNGKPWRIMVELTPEEFATIIREEMK